MGLNVHGGMIEDESNLVTARIARREFPDAHTGSGVFLRVIRVTKGAVYTGTLACIPRLENISRGGFGHGPDLTCRRLNFIRGRRAKRGFDVPEKRDVP